MKLLIRLFLISAYFILSSTTCDDDIEEIEFFMTNDSGETIYVISWIFEDNHLMLPAEVFPVAKKIIKSNEKGKVDGGPKEFFENGATQLLVYKESTLEKYTEQEIKKYDIYDKRFFLTLEDLEACNFLLKYSDGEDMTEKHIKL